MTAAGHGEENIPFDSVHLGNLQKCSRHDTGDWWVRFGNQNNLFRTGGFQSGLHTNSLRKFENTDVGGFSLIDMEGGPALPGFYKVTPLLPPTPAPPHPSPSHPNDSSQAQRDWAPPPRAQILYANQLLWGILSFRQVLMTRGSSALKRETEALQAWRVWWDIGHWLPPRGGSTNRSHYYYLNEKIIEFIKIRRENCESWYTHIFFWERGSPNTGTEPLWSWVPPGQEGSWPCWQLPFEDAGEIHGWPLPSTETILPFLSGEQTGTHWGWGWLLCEHSQKMLSF